jgi:hypothetical protein
MSLILSGTDGLSDVDGSASTPAIRGTDTNTGIFFPAADTIAFAEGGAECARFDSNGRLGLGTTNPTAKLTVSTSASNEGVIRVSDNATFYGELNRINATDEVRLGSYGASQNLTFYTVSSERMRITSAGNVLINSTSGTLPLSVQGIDGGAAAGMFTGATAGVGNDLIYFYSSGQGALLGYIGYNGSVVTYNTTSDYRLKDNIEPMIGALEKISALKPVTYTWKLNNANGHGFIAHELAEVFPDAVSGEKDGIFEDGKIRPQGIDTSILVATLTAAIQEQQAIITDLKSRIEALEAK